jgi:hypothetical protein
MQKNLKAADDADEVKRPKDRRQVRKTKGEQITGKTNFVLFADFYNDCEPTNGPGPLPKQKATTLGGAWRLIANCGA